MTDNSDNKLRTSISLILFFILGSLYSGVTKAKLDLRVLQNGPVKLTEEILKEHKI